MINILDKTSIRDSIIVADTEIYMKPEYIIENIIKYLYSDEIYKYRLNINLNNVVYITDGYDTTPININLNGQEHLIETYSILRFHHDIIDTNFLESLRFTKSIVIIGCINRIDPNLLNKVMLHFNSHINVIYGDSSLTLDTEYEANYTTLFSNIKIDIKSPYDADIHNINKKKIYNVLTKIRKGVEHEKISRSNIFDVQENNIIDITEILEYLDEDVSNCVVVPDIYYQDVMSTTRYYSSGCMDLTPKIGELMYNVHPVILIDTNNNKNFIKPYSLIAILEDPDSEPFIEDKKILQKITISIDGVIYRDVIMDFGFFISNFNPDRHPEHEELYDIISKLNFIDDKQKFNPFKLPFNSNEIQCVPFKILKSIYVKYGSFNNIKVFNKVLNDSFNIPSITYNSIYNSMCTATNKIELIESTNFEII